MTDTPRKFLNDFNSFGEALYAATQKVIGRPDKKITALETLLNRLPQVCPTDVALDQDWVTIGRAKDLSASEQADLNHVLTHLKPWRKGPFDLFGICIDSEWNSALKWKRLAPHFAPLKNRRILDVGSSNGYYLLRMAAAKPRVVLGIEPYIAYYYQYLALQHFVNLPQVYCLPLKLETLPESPGRFDTIFCMGILYHRRSPLETLIDLKKRLAPGGQLILETLILPGDTETALSPRHRYACMRNVHFIPTVACLENWLLNCGFKEIRCVDITKTTLDEQRKTSWIDSDSLDAFLDPNDSGLTKEGYPAPVRAIMIAEC